MLNFLKNIVTKNNVVINERKMNDNKSVSTITKIPKWIGTGEIHYYTLDEVREIVKNSYQSRNLQPHFFSNQCVQVIRYEKDHPYWSDEIHCLILTNNSYIKDSKLIVKADEDGINKATTHIWNLLKKIYVEEINVDIETMELIEK